MLWACGFAKSSAWLIGKTKWPWTTQSGQWLPTWDDSSISLASMTWVILTPVVVQTSMDMPWPCSANETAWEIVGAKELIRSAAIAIQCDKWRLNEIPMDWDFIWFNSNIETWYLSIFAMLEHYWMDIYSNWLIKVIWFADLFTFLPEFDCLIAWFFLSRRSYFSY